MATLYGCRLITALVSGAVALASASYAQDVPAQLPVKLKPRVTVLPYKGRASPAQRQVLSATNKTIPLWSHSAASGFTFEMVGRSPLKAESKQETVINTAIVPIRFTFKDSGGNVIGTSDPTQPDGCSPNGSALDLTLASPIFRNIVFKQGVNLGKGQYASLFQRGSFYAETNSTGINPDYQVTLRPKLAATFDVTITSPATGQEKCGKLWALDISFWDNIVQTQVFPALTSQGYGPTTFPLLLFYNVVLYDGNVNNCCILGYHSAFDNPDFGNTFQTYGIADFEVSGAFDPSAVSDTSVMSHEVAEWMDDPPGTNPTPPWGHIGQVSGCQNNLEVGDPLSGIIFPITMSNGYTYHLQDLAFWPWFFGGPAPFKVKRKSWYSMYGTFTTPAAACH